MVVCEHASDRVSYDWVRLGMATEKSEPRRACRANCKCGLPCGGDLRNYEFDRAHWPILMVLMWIAARQRKFIEAVSEAESSDGPRYAKPNPQSLDTYLAFEELTQKLPDGEMTSIAAARQAFESEARKGTLTVSGVREGREHTVLSALQLQCLKLVEYNTEFFVEPGGWTDVLVDRAGVLEIWPELHDSNSQIKALGRPVGSGKIDDTPLLIQMKEMLASGDAKSPNDAATKLAPQAKGAGTEESKKKRLVKNYRELEASETSQ